jgi:hypothetical protein
MTMRPHEELKELFMRKYPSQKLNEHRRVFHDQRAVRFLQPPPVPPPGPKFCSCVTCA